MKLISIFLLLLISCEFNKIKIQTHQVEVAENNFNSIELLIYEGTTNRQSYQHIFLIDSLELIVKGKSYYIDSFKEKHVKLTSFQKDSLQNCIDFISEKVYIDSLNYGITGNWEVELRINQKLIFYEGNFMFEKAPIEFKNLIGYIIDLSPLKFNAYGFGYP